MFKSSSIREVIDNNFYEDLSKGLNKIIERHPDLLEVDSLLLFPAIEGVGFYPCFSQSLQIPEENLWVAGDASGDFRGLVPALISGYASGLSILEAYNN